MDVGAWLRGIGLGQYETTFRESEIDAEVLPDLTEGDLSQLGMPLGHRKRLLKAIAALGAPETAAKPPGSPHASPSATAERRPITVMFCDLVGSTSLAATLDAEDWRTLVNTYLDEASAAVTGLGGHVLKKLGDGLMALFGYPHAQENDAERAVRAALAIQRALVEINARNVSKSAPELSARIGLDSGQVVVDATGEVFGDAPNVAARVQSAAGPGSILITPAVQRQTAGLFVAEDRGQHELKGLSAPMTLYRVVRASGGGRRGGARALTPLAGREEELGLLGRRWDRARQGDGQLALIVGEPGLGKSRLMEEFHARLGETPHTWVEWSSSQLLQNTPLHPISEWGRQRFGADLTTEQRLADLENTLVLIGLDPTEYAPLLAPLVDVLLPEDRVAKLAPEELRRRQLAAMTAWILAAARTQAIVLAFEDLHWADPTSLDLMRALAERGAQAPLLIIATARPEFRAPWSVRSHHSVISLSPLDSVQITKMVRELSSRHALPKDIVEGVSERTGGVPLFVEEVTRLLLERSEHGGAQAIPPTLQQSLAARLDRLGSARETAQIGAVLGRGFSYSLLQSVAGLDKRALQAALERLAEADILFVEGDGARATYRFKHALIQDAAYDSLLKSRRQALHRRAAEILCDSASPEPEAIAHHFTQAGLDDLAIEWWGNAGDQALRRSAFQEAIAHLGKAIEMADKAAGAREPAPAVAQSGEVTLSERFRRQRLQVAYGNALIAARGHTAPETTEAFAKVRESGAGGADVRELAAADYGLWVASYGRGELPPMRVHSAAFLEDVAARPDSVEACVAHRVAGSTHWFAGEYREAREHLERAVALFQPGRDDDVAFRFGQDAGVAATLFLTIVLWVLGDVARAIALARQAHERIERIPHANTRAYGKLHMALFELIRGEVSRAVPNVLELGRVARENDLPLFRALAEFLEAWAKSQTAGSADAREEMSRAADVLHERNIRCFDGPLKFAHAQEEARLGDPERAISIVDDAMADFDRRGHRAMDAELRRVRGETLLKRHPANPGPAEEAFKAAIAIAQQQGARSFEARAALALAKLYQSTARPVEAHAVLAPALQGFAPTPEMPEIAEAQALLAALEATDEVKATEAQRQRRLHLQTAYGQAMMYSKGFAAEETKAAFAQAAELAVKSDDFSQRFAAAHGQWTVALVRGELKSARDMASAFLQEGENQGRLVEAGVARRGLALICYLVGDFAQARAHCERALAVCEPERDREARERFSEDTGCIAMSILATTSWQLGEVDRARELIDMANRRAVELGHAPSMAHPLQSKFSLELLRGDPAAALAAAEALAALGRDHGMPHWLVDAELYAIWARCRLRDPTASAALAASQGARSRGWFSRALLAELELRTSGVESALARIDEALALARQGETRRDLALPYLLRGEFLLQCDPPNPSAAEEAFQSALAVAREQGARSWGLRAALALSKLYQSTGRPTEAHAVLAPGLEGFAPTREMPEIAEALELMAAIKPTEASKAAVRYVRNTSIVLKNSA
jgi:class 3 adenylate cyclase/tetratricopeptide (TPR) repeat protein